MTFNYSRIAQTVQRLLANFGKAATVTVTRAGIYDPATGTTADPSITVLSCVAVMFDFADKTEGTQFAPDSLIVAGDKQVYMSAPNSGAPEPGAVLAWVDGNYHVKAVKVIAPAGVAVLYELQVRR